MNSYLCGSKSKAFYVASNEGKISFAFFHLDSFRFFLLEALVMRRHKNYLLMEDIWNM